ncbi:hypothetical protein ACGFMK_06720 [Amycolatopsis sp. NPDC049252]|uniref:hypothetical protein n=1 Tax=Amycolatopsis sp. NPDC049252 TaxID=3363933 RepID=UPI0037165E86
MTWLALNGESSAAVAGIFANFSAFGRYCADVAAGMRAHYGFDDAACVFFGFFAADVPEIEAQAPAAIQAGIDAHRLDVHEAPLCARLFQSYERQFWNTLADEFPG